MKWLEICFGAAINCNSIREIRAAGKNIIYIFNIDHVIPHEIEHPDIGSEQLYEEIVKFLTCDQNNFYSIPKYIERRLLT